MIEDVPLDLLNVRDDRVRRDVGDLVGLMNSMREFGQFNPLIIDGDCNIIEGTRRYYSAKLLGWSTIRCERRLDLSDYDKISIETDENLRRKNFNPAEEAVAIALRKRAYLEEHPEARHGGDRQSERFRSQARDQEDRDSHAFAAIEAERLNLSERSIYRFARIGEFLLEGRMSSKLYQRIATRKVSQKDVLKLIAKDSITGERNAVSSRKAPPPIAPASPSKECERPEPFLPEKAPEGKVAVQKSRKQPPVFRTPEAIKKHREGDPSRESGEETLTCKDCQLGVMLTCPECGKPFIACQQYPSNPFLRKVTSPACEAVKRKHAS